MLAVRVEHHHGVGGVRERRLDAGGHGRALAMVGAHPDQLHTLVAGGRLELGGQLLRRAVVDEHYVIGVAQRPGDHVADALGAEDGDHRDEPLDRRQDGGGERDRLAAPLRPGERHEAGEADRPIASSAR